MRLQYLNVGDAFRFPPGITGMSPSSVYVVTSKNDTEGTVQTIQIGSGAKPFFSGYYEVLRVTQFK